MLLCGLLTRELRTCENVLRDPPPLDDRIDRSLARGTPSIRLEEAFIEIPHRPTRISSLRHPPRFSDRFYRLTGLNRSDGERKFRRLQSDLIVGMII